MLVLFASACFLLTDADLAARLTLGGDPGDSASSTDSTDSGDTSDTGNTHETGDTSDTGGALTWWYTDSDGDGSGDPEDGVQAAEQPERRVGNAWDCDDTEPREPVWVSTRGSSAASGGLPDPFASIQEGFAAATQCVRVEAGDYDEELDPGGRNLDVWGVDGSATTVVHGFGGRSVLSVDGAETFRFRGFTLTGGGGNLSSMTEDYHVGGGVSVSGADLTMEDVVVTGNQAGGGGGVWLGSGSLTLTDVVISDNQGEGGGGLVQESGTLVGTRVRIEGNTGTYGAAGLLTGGFATFSNLIVNANRGSLGSDGLYLMKEDLTLTNATFVDLDIAITLDAVSVDPSTLRMTNVIIGYMDYGVKSYGESEAVAWYNVLYGWNVLSWDPTELNPAGTQGNQEVNAELVAVSADGNPTNDDVHLAAGSPCVDAEDPAILDADGSVSDVGAFGGPSARP